MLSFALFATACSSDEATGSADAPPHVDAGAPDAGANLALRGRYLVDSVLSCGDCHTPRAGSGPSSGMYLAGVVCFIDAHPPANDGTGCLNTGNLPRLRRGPA